MGRAEMGDIERDGAERKRDGRGQPVLWAERVLRAAEQRYLGSVRRSCPFRCRLELCWNWVPESRAA